MRMNHRKTSLVAISCAILFSLGATIARAQDPSQEPADAKPKPAARSNPVNVDTSDQPDQPANSLQPDNTPLTGITNPTLGNPEMRHSYWVPGFTYGNNIQSSSVNQSSSNSGWLDDNYFVANVSLIAAWNRSELAVNYSGGGYVSTDNSRGNGLYQNMSLAESITLNRWSLQVLDQFSYLPQTQFGFGGTTNLGVPGVGGSTGPTIPPVGGIGTNQSIFTSIGPRYSNTGALQATYTVTRRGSITASGSFTILRFIDPGNIDSNNINGSLGYNYALTKQDTLGLVYRYGGFQFYGQPQAYGDHVVNIAYGRKLTGRLALQLAGGPEITYYRIPIGNQSRKVSGNANASLLYAFQNGGISVGYTHSLTAGSGVLVGSTTDQLYFSGNRKLSRIWTGNFNVGYAHNKNVDTSGLASSPTYNTIYAGGGVGRAFGRNIDFSASYNATIAKFSTSPCPVMGSCTQDTTYNYITLTFQFHTRPLVLW